MHNNKEVRRAVAQFLNGIAIAVLVAGAICPSATALQLGRA